MKSQLKTNLFLLVLLISCTVVTGQEMSIYPDEINLNDEILIQPNGGQFSFPIIQFRSGTNFREIGLRGGDKIGIDGDVIPYSSSTFDLGNNVANEHWDRVVCNITLELSPLAPVIAKSARLDQALAHINMLKTYSYKSNDGGMSLSFDYDVLKKHFPEAVGISDDTADQKNRLPTIRDSAFTPLIVKALQEQSQLIEAQQIKIEELSRELEQMKVKIEN